MFQFPISVLKSTRSISSSNLGILSTFWKFLCFEEGIPKSPKLLTSFSGYFENLDFKSQKMPQTKTKSAGQTKSVPAGESTLQKIEKNAQLTENLIAEICDKVIEIETMRAKQRPQNAEILQLREENQQLRDEIEKWRELLIIRQIRNGRKFIRQPVVKIKPETGDEGSSGSVPLPIANVVTSTKVSGSTKTPASEVAVKTEQKTTQAPESQKPPTTSGSVGAGSQGPGKGQKGKPAKPEGDKTPVVAKKDKEGGQGPPASTEVIDVSRLDFRVGLITHCERHPDAESLYLEKIDVGEPNPRTVVSGLVKHVPLEAMQNRMVIVLCNLKPAKMRGVTSEAMVMCASTPDKVEILIPPAGAVPGDLVDFEGFIRNPDPIMNPKKKIFETVAPDLMTSGEKVATYKGIAFTIKGKGVVTTETLPNVNIK